LLSVLAGSAVFLLWITPLPNWTHLGVPVASFVPTDNTGALRWDLIAVRTFGAVLVVPVMEELFWRSFLMRWIDKRNFLSQAPRAASLMAMVASSAVFALAHDLWLCAFCAGLIYAQIYRRTENIWYSVLAHAATNLLLAIWVVSWSAWSYW
jgi:CAAX prenyl protease-like protein